MSIERVEEGKTNTDDMDAASRALTLEADEITSYDKEGFTSALYEAGTDEYKGKCLVIVGGSDGRLSLTRLIAEQYVKRGVSVLALAWWNEEGLPEELAHCPLETAEKAAIWLGEKGYEKIGILGISEGACFALLAASYMPSLYSACVAISPLFCAGQAMRMKGDDGSRTELLEGSIFSWRGKDVPNAPLAYNGKKVYFDTMRKREPMLLSVYKDIERSCPEEARIPVENINGPVLFLSSDSDSMWPSSMSADIMMKRLDEKGFPHTHKFYHYEKASHLLIPYRLNSRKMYLPERKWPTECWENCKDSFEKTLFFLKYDWRIESRNL